MKKALDLNLLVFLNTETTLRISWSHASSPKNMRLGTHGHKVYRPLQRPMSTRSLSSHAECRQREQAQQPRRKPWDQQTMGQLSKTNQYRRLRWCSQSRGRRANWSQKWESFKRKGWCTESIIVNGSDNGVGDGSRAERQNLWNSQPSTLCWKTGGGGGGVRCHRRGTEEEGQNAQWEQPLGLATNSHLCQRSFGRSDGHRGQNAEGWVVDLGKDDHKQLLDLLPWISSSSFSHTPACLCSLFLPEAQPPPWHPDSKTEIQLSP